MKVKITEIKSHMARALKAKGFGDDDTDFLINMYLGGELRGHITHGLASFSDFVQDDWSKLPEPKVVKETASLFMIDAKSNPGALVGKRAADEAIKRAQKEAVGTAIIKNMDSWLRPGAIAQYIAEQGYFAIVVNDGGSASIAPPGGYDPVIGTNPIAYGIPTDNDPLVVDMATSQRAWGQVRLAKKYDKNLPGETFYDDKGEFTLDPDKVHSVAPFGSYKGFALGLLVEILCGSIIGMDNMFVVKKSATNKFAIRLTDRGGFILVIDPGQTAGGFDYKAANTELISRIENTHTLKNQTIRIPGKDAGKLQRQRIKADEIDIPSELWEEIKGL